jgi:hypothetical protein
MPDAQRFEQIFLAVLVYVLAGFFLKDMGEQFRSAAVVVPDLSGLRDHRLVDCVLHPVIAGFHQACIVLRIAGVEALVIPFETRRHGQQVT